MELSPHVRIRVLRDLATANCPDAPALRAALLSHRGQPLPEALVLSVEFARQVGATAAKVTASGARSGTRELRVMTDDCRALLEPLAVSLSMLMDPDAGSDPTAVPVTPGSTGASSAASEADPLNRASAAGSARSQPQQPLPRGPDPRNGEAKSLREGTSTGDEREPLAQATRAGRGAHDASAEPPRWGLGADFGPALVWGLVPNDVVGFELQLDAHYRNLSLRLAATDCAPKEQSFGQAKVRGQSTFGRLGLCLQVQRFGALALALCQGTWLGQLAVEGRGFGADGESSPWFLALGGLFDMTFTAYGPLGFGLRAGVFAPVTQHHFTVDGVSGSAFTSQAVGGSVGTSIHWKFL